MCPQFCPVRCGVASVGLVSIEKLRLVFTLAKVSVNSVKIHDPAKRFAATFNVVALALVEHCAQAFEAATATAPAPAPKQASQPNPNAAPVRLGCIVDKTRCRDQAAISGPTVSRIAAARWLAEPVGPSKCFKPSAMRASPASGNL
jgi:hypothetical protein